MKVQEKFTLDASPDELWKVIQDIPAVAGCIPGVEEFAPLEDGVYRGTIKMKMGPLALNFKGEIKILSVDEEQRVLVMSGEGSDSKVASMAKMTQSLQVVPEEQGASIFIEADVDLRGKLASLGWGLIRPKVTSMTRDFAQNLKTYLETGTPPVVIPSSTR
ncbi:SRPBCC family protein [Alicyclobacillus tolerans]|uniref:CoxG family protein n=1 Tax=Alicyclobacillus tolerans TaxID=90970 RepID=UPI001F3F1CB1|nr:SRPBCC family protein [Alicyclobacillus tolerans]MCF8563202.1 SRPBCC family protein [Alicyclobacillus tolerans]